MIRKLKLIRITIRAIMTIRIRIIIILMMTMIITLLWILRFASASFDEKIKKKTIEMTMITATKGKIDSRPLPQYFCA